MNSKNVIQRLRGESDRMRKSVYLSDKLCQEFLKIIGSNHSLSEGLEALMKEFVEDFRKPKAKKPAKKS